MSLKKARETFKEMINLCYEEDYPELHKELVSLESDTKKNKEYNTAMQELLDIIPVFTDDFPIDVLLQLEEIYQEFLEE